MEAVEIMGLLRYWRECPPLHLLLRPAAPEQQPMEYATPDDLKRLRALVGG